MDHFNNGVFESTDSDETEEQLTSVETGLWNKMADSCISNPETRLDQSIFILFSIWISSV